MSYQSDCSVLVGTHNTCCLAHIPTWQTRILRCSIVLVFVGCGQRLGIANNTPHERCLHHCGTTTKKAWHRCAKCLHHACHMCSRYAAVTHYVWHTLSMRFTEVAHIPHLHEQRSHAFLFIARAQQWCDWKKPCRLVDMAHVTMCVVCVEVATGVSARHVVLFYVFDMAILQSSATIFKYPGKLLIDGPSCWSPASKH